MFGFLGSLARPLRRSVIFALAAGLVFYAAGTGSSRAAEIVLLSSLDVSKTVQSSGRVQINKSYVGRPLTIAGRRFEHGVGTHAISTLAIDLKGGADRFIAFVGVDDDNGKNVGTVEFRLIGDGRVLWRSGIMKTGDAAKPVDVDLKGIRSLILRVSDTRDGIDCDHADWAEAKFEVSGEKPETVAAPPMKQDRAVILTPKSPATPRINGAKAFSARPGHPYLFTIPATGQRPMEYAVDNLPTGLKLDPKTGQITGVLKQRGEYPVTFQVKNALGQAERPFKIVCGDTLALTPHMGWNSWYVWGQAITQEIMQRTADAMVGTGLIDHGYMYVNVDDCWTVKPDSPDPTLQGTPRDADGNIIPNKRFPDMKAMADYIHRKGLKAGIYTGPSDITCALHTGSKGHEEQDARQYAKWGYDFLKYDPTGRTTAPRMGAILQTLDRDIVLNIVGGDIIGSHDPSWARPAGVHSWRTGTDLGGSWRRVIDDLFGLYGQNEIQKYHGPGGWNDPDYISIGYLRGGSRTSLTPNQQYSYVSIWCLLAAPLIFSGDVMRLDDFTLSLLTNDEVIEVDQDLLGKPALRVAKDGGREVWAKDMEDGRKAVGLFNLDGDESDQTASVTAKWSDLGIRGKRIVRDLWRQKDLGVYEDRFTAMVEPDGVVLLNIRPQSKWATSVRRVIPQERRLAVPIDVMLTRCVAQRREPPFLPRIGHVVRLVERCSPTCLGRPHRRAQRPFARIRRHIYRERRWQPPLIQRASPHPRQQMERRRASASLERDLPKEPCSSRATAGGVPLFRRRPFSQWRCPGRSQSRTSPLGRNPPPSEKRNGTHLPAGSRPRPSP